MRFKIPPPVITILAALAMVGLNTLFEIRFLKYDIIITICIILSILGAYFLSYAVVAFIKAKTTVNPLKPESATTLVTDGVYRYSRNPMYAGMALFLFAWSLWLLNPLNIIIFIAYIGYINQFQIKPEEQALAKIFTVEYEAYRTQVRRWL